MRKNIWSIEYCINSYRGISPGNHITETYSVDKTHKTKFKTLEEVYEQCLKLKRDDDNQPHWKDYVHACRILKNGEEGYTVILPGGYIIWDDLLNWKFGIEVIDPHSNLFEVSRTNMRTGRKHFVYDYTLIILKAWYGVTPKIFKTYYPKLDLKKTMKKELGSLYF